MTHKVILNRPVAGLNDTLCQVARCWDYAIDHDRILVIDPFPGSARIDLLKYLLPFGGSGCHVWAGLPSLYERLNSYTSVVPSELAGLIDQKAMCRPRGLGRLWIGKTGKDRGIALEV